MEISRIEKVNEFPNFPVYFFFSNNKLRSLKLLCTEIFLLSSISLLAAHSGFARMLFVVNNDRSLIILNMRNYLLQKRIKIS